MVLPTNPSSFKLVGPGEQPDIGYSPDLEKYRARTALRLRAEPELPKAPLPAGFPTKVEGPLVWKGNDWTDESQWVYNLNEAELQEIDAAVVHFKSLEVPLGHISASTFPLPNLSASLRDLSKELHNGRGFFVLRTIPVDSYSKEDIGIVYAGISSHVANTRARQDVKGSVLAHIKDLRATHDTPMINAAYTTDAQIFHTDAGVLVSLLALNIAAEGGTSKISSCAQIYNELVDTRPDIIKTLAEPWPVDRFGGDPLYVQKPLLFYEDDKIVIQYSRRNFTGYQAHKRNPEIPPITEAQAEALDALHYTAEKYCLKLNFQKGDIQYINSWALLHARDAFRDDPEHPRHLLRLWLWDEELAWKMPAGLKPTFERLYSIKPEEQEFPLEPEIRKFR
ncbi:hypothetical protein TWF694_005573 [Orbilia ellipsospora]|uniref:TauD/TfdA-like domain-containing protein n=1 Tax=Orbilia ellipsospora TaxID=2528407 RepID=A0AAV9WUQ8_9PEZI